EAARQGEDRDDQFGRVAEGRVEEAADPGARVFAEFFRRKSQEQGERDDRDPSGREHDRGRPEHYLEDAAEGDEEAEEGRPGLRAEGPEVHCQAQQASVLTLVANVALATAAS